MQLLRQPSTRGTSGQSSVYYVLSPAVTQLTTRFKVPGYLQRIYVSHRSWLMSGPASNTTRLCFQQHRSMDWAGRGGGVSSRNRLQMNPADQPVTTHSDRYRGKCMRTKDAAIWKTVRGLGVGTCMPPATAADATATAYQRVPSRAGAGVLPVLGCLTVSGCLGKACLCWFSLCSNPKTR